MGGPVKLRGPGGPKSLCADLPCWRCCFHPLRVISHSCKVELNWSWSSPRGGLSKSWSIPCSGMCSLPGAQTPPLPPPFLAVCLLLPQVSVVFLDPCAPWGFDGPPALEGPLVSAGPPEPAGPRVPPPSSLHWVLPGSASSDFSPRVRAGDSSTVTEYVVPAGSFLGVFIARILGNSWASPPRLLAWLRRYYWTTWARPLFGAALVMLVPWSRWRRRCQ